MAKENKKMKSIAALLIISIFLPTIILFSAPKKAEAIPVAEIPGAIIHFIAKQFTVTTAVQTTTNTALHFKDIAREIVKQLLMAVAKRALQEMTKSTVNWINSGFHGAPLFLENPDSFFKDIAKSEIKTAVDKLGYDVIKFPFGKDFALNIINGYKSKLENNASYSLSEVMRDDPVLLYNYQNNFNVGGWSGFFVNTMYPQNNYLGFTISATERLAMDIQNAKQKVQTTLEQGQGFLSPKICDTNPNYNNGVNEWNQPSWGSQASKFEQTYMKNHPYPETGGVPSPADEEAVKKWNADYEYALSEEKNLWEYDNACPGGLKSTTPGAVVANQIMTSLNIPMNSTLQAMGLGNSLSAIFDALLNKFIGDGLSALASKTNPKPQEDDWSYDGIKLGSAPATGTNTTWDTGPDQVIELTSFKKTVSDGLENTAKEIMLMTNDAPNESGPGIMQLFGEIWPKAQQLDVCQPGPDFGWSDRIETEKTKNDSKLISEDEDPTAGNLALNELSLAVSFFKDWLNTQMSNALPSSASYMDAINDLKNLYQEASELASKIAVKKQALITLQVIKRGLDNITTPPTPDSEEDRAMVLLWKQYNTITDSVTNDNSLQDTQNQLNLAKDKSANLDKLITQCASERTAKGWANPGGATSVFTGTASGYTTGAPEQAMFCDYPISGGYSHESFINTGTVTYPRLPLVNAQNVSIGSKSVNISLSCGIIYRASALDYKGTLPGY
ncbi:MAG: hypothetical protein WCT44_00765 [Candidatus Paceibacterota bacterium]